MTMCIKTRRSTKDRKKSPGRPGQKALQDIPDDDGSGLSTFLKEADIDPKKADGSFFGRRDAFASYMADIGTISDPLSSEEELAMATEIQKGLAGAVKALKKALPVAGKMTDLSASLGSAKTPTEAKKSAALFIRLNPEGLRGKRLDKHIERSSITDLGLSMLEWHDPRVYRVAVRFIHANLRLVLHLVRIYSRSGYMQLVDLVQEGNTGLVIATLRFDPSRGFRFSTYGSWWIRHALGRAMADKGRTIRLPVHMVEFSVTIRRVRRELADRLDRLPTDEELIEAVGCKADWLTLLRGCQNEPRSLDEVVDSHGNTIGSFISTGTPDVSEWATLVPEKATQLIHAEIERLSPIERDILRLRFSFDDEDSLTLKEIGAMYGLSRERIRLLQEQAIKKLRKRLARHFAAAI